MDLPEKLRKLREDCNWSQGFVADLMKVHRSTISKYETGKVTPTYQTLLQLADIYKVEKDLLIDELDGSWTGKSPYILRENLDDPEMDLIKQLLQKSPELKKTLLIMYNFDDKKLAQAIAIFQAQIHAMKNG